MIIALASIFTLVSMLNQNKALSAVICILGLFVLLIAGIMINNQLSMPEYYDEYAYIDPDVPSLYSVPINRLQKAGKIIAINEI